MATTENDYTPDTDTVRGNYAAFGTPGYPREAREEAFDRWLAKHDRKIMAMAWDEGVRYALPRTPEALRSELNPYRVTA